MKKFCYTDSQIIAIVEQAEAGRPIPKLCREHGMSNATFYKWRAKKNGATCCTALQRVHSSGLYGI
ncbi:hypothetical protein GCM10023337_10150 [Paenalcaligenes hermetiae]|uniref:Transposase n=1 Tax=Paenalcaligenes hermetiae TaxID=1157987 RepID=A0ABP9LZA2_9BURK